ncbi:hypothetical protein TRFO_28855 [Tritrichomonas foetus]|uniref:Uncharacterized protein n=1 Tax=Tritrichomonas foetus TaxID=1144522 RepID=A0A1J4JXF0_9EUKA|nr:hypothetical protein TRFO_28855 [Tritrichomonas foetus]|eukprot:OHT03667.1 hypothetical protein TRFO_28855 [Tritrichomonas foetus]
MPVSKNLLDKCLTTLYRMATSNPEAITEDIANILSRLVPQAPKKCLVIIRSYIDRIDDIGDPWSVISVLNQQMNSFITSEVAVQYISLIYYLFENIAELKENQLEYYETEFIRCLSNRRVKDDALNAIYRFLAQLSDSLDLNDETTALHLSKPAVQKSVINLLLHCNVLLGPNTLSKLSTIKLHSAAYVILKFSLPADKSKPHESDHSNMVKYPCWLENNQITPALKMRLFLAVLLDKKCRSRLAQLPQTTAYLNFLVETKNGEVMKMISTCVRRLISEESLHNFQESGFFQNYWNTVMEINDQNVTNAAIMCIDKLVKVGFLDDLNIILPTMKKVINFGGGIAEQAIKIVSSSSRFQECVPVLKKHGFPKYFAKLKETRNFTKECRMFEKNIS